MRKKSTAWTERGGERKHRRTHRHPEAVATMANADFSRVQSLSEAMGLYPQGPTVTIDRECHDDEGKLIEKRVVEYLGHVVGGMIRVRLPDGRETIIHPHATEELRP